MTGVQTCALPISVFAVEYLPGQFDQRADSAAQCIQIISTGERPLARSAKVYAVYGDLTAEEIEAIKKYVINPVEAREAALEKPETIRMEYEIPTEVAVLEGFNELDEEGRAAFIKDYGLAMDEGDIKFCQDYFISEHRDPTIKPLCWITFLPESSPAAWFSVRRRMALIRATTSRGLKGLTI